MNVAVDPRLTAPLIPLLAATERIDWDNVAVDLGHKVVSYDKFLDELRRIQVFQRRGDGWKSLGREVRDEHVRFVAAARRAHPNSLEPEIHDVVDNLWQWMSPLLDEGEINPIPLASVQEMLGLGK